MSNPSSFSFKPSTTSLSSSHIFSRFRLALTTTLFFSSYTILLAAIIFYSFLQCTRPLFSPHKLQKKLSPVFFHVKQLVSESIHSQSLTSRTTKSASLATPTSELFAIFISALLTAPLPQQTVALRALNFKQQSKGTEIKLQRQLRPRLVAICCTLHPQILSTQRSHSTLRSYFSS